MQFKGLDDNGYKEVCEFIAERATGVKVDHESVSIKRSGVSIGFMFGMLGQIIIEKNFADFNMGGRPYCNVRVALKKTEPWELAELYKQVGATEYPFHADDY